MKRDKFSRSPFNVCICYNFPVSKISLQIKIARKSNQVERYVFAITFRYLILNSWFWSIFSHIPKLYCVQNKSMIKKHFFAVHLMIIVFNVLFWSTFTVSISNTFDFSTLESLVKPACCCTRNHFIFFHKILISIEIWHTQNTGFTITQQH